MAYNLGTDSPSSVFIASIPSSSKLSKAVTEASAHDLARGLLYSYWIIVAVLILIAGVLGILFSHMSVVTLNMRAALIDALKEVHLSISVVFK